MTKLSPSARALIESGALAHLVTLARDGSPRVTCVWVGLDGDEIVAGHLNKTQRKLARIAHDPRVALSLQASSVNDLGLQEYLVVRGTARLQEGGAPELLQRLAHVYLGPDVTFPAMPDPPDGFVSRITVEQISGIGPWMEGL
ncbi:MAG: PPOX class F420-dependent oxidoreductase [Solirubrobacteraceae bacterium]|jgi:PPOX class probable F420-dependent enzyme